MNIIKNGPDTYFLRIDGSGCAHEERIEAIRNAVDFLEVDRARLDDPDLLHLYDQIRQLANEMCFKLQNQSYLPEEADKHLEELITLFKQQRILYLQKKHLKDLCQESYPLVLRRGEILLLYKSWEIQLEEKSREIQQTYPNRDTVSAALKVKELLYSEKSRLFSQLFSHPRCSLKGIECAFFVCNLHKRNQTVNKEQLLSRLSQLIEASRMQITVFEQTLIRPIGWRSSLTASLLRLATTHPHAVVSSGLVDGLSPVIGAQLKTRLPFFVLIVTKVVSTLALIVMDLLVWWWVGLYHSLLRTVSRQVSPSMLSCIGPFRRLGYDEKTTAKCFPVVHEIIESMLYVGFQRYFDRESPTVEIAVHYTVVRVSQWAVVFFVRRCYQATCKKGERAEHSATYPLVSFVAQLGSTYFSEHYAWPYARAKWYRIAACRSLGVYPTANKETIRRAYRIEARKWHPDNKKTGNVARFRLLKRAKELCLKGAL